MSKLGEAFKKAMEENPELEKLSRLVETEIVDKLKSGELDEKDVQSALVRLSEEDSVQDILGFNTEEGPGLPGLNPVIAAQLAERLSFDGDVPEMRTGALPEGARPAVPVDTETLNPLHLGALLRNASEEVLSEMRALASENSSSSELALCEEDPVGYVRGSLPAMRNTEVSPLAVSEEKDLSWLAISTTQGRRSSGLSLERNLIAKLKAEGFEVSLGSSQDPNPDFSHEWTVSIADKGVCHQFSHANTALSVFAARSVRFLRESPGEYVMGITTVDDIPERVVGWRVDLWRSR